MPIPAFVNPASGGAEQSLAALAATPAFEVRPAPAGDLPALLAAEAARGTARVLVAGGDGTIASAATALMGTGVALGLLPGGTLNHFARDHGIPDDAAQALEIAAGGPVTTTDLGCVNDQVFIGTSSVGAYTRYVRTREEIEPLLGYWAASVVAGLRVLTTLRTMVVTLETEGVERRYESPLVFVGVGERRLGLPGLGRRMPNGRRGLHVLVPRGRREARRFARAYRRERQGVPDGGAFAADTALVDRLRLTLHAPAVEVALDGELRRVRTPLEYRVAPDALRLVVPPREAGD